MSAAGPSPKSDRVTQDELLSRVRPPEWRNPQPRQPYDLVILGGGPAGLSSAELARRQGRSVALLERGRLGGNSLNSGSIPSKAIIRAAQELSSLRDEEDYGAVAFKQPSTDFAAVMARMRRIRTRLAEYHSAERLRRQGIDLYFCNARFAAPNVLLAGDTPLSFKKAIVATGARPRVLPGAEPDGERILTWRQLYDLTEIPRDLIVVGSEIGRASCRERVLVTV